MSDIQYDTRTGAVMAGGLSGSGHAKAGKMAKQQLAAIRADCAEAKSRSNQDLILLLENYNDQTDLVVEALKNGEADAILGGWATTLKKGKGANKSKKISESDLGHDNVSETSNSKAKTSQSSAPLILSKGQPESKPRINGSNANTTAKPEPVISKSVSKQGNHDSSVLSPSSVLAPKEVPIPEIHTHAASFNRLLIQASETHIDDLKNLDLAFEQIRRLVEHRYESLRRNLERSDEQINQALQHRRTQSTQLSDVVTQSSALSPKEYAEWQQDVAKFTADYKFDLHLASSPLFSYSLDGLQKELNKFGNVAGVLPSYSYKPPEIKVSHPEKRAQPAVNTSAKQHAAVNQHSSAHANEFPVHNQNNSHSARNHAHTDSRKDKIPHAQESARIHEKLPESRERVTIVPKEVKGVAPMESLVISGGNLTAEELAKLTLSLQNSLQYPTQPRNDPPKTNQNGGFGSGDFSEQDIFSGGAVWTNSNTFVADTWNSPTSDQQPPQPLSGFSASVEGFQPTSFNRNGPAPARGGPGYRGARRGTRGQQNGRGSRPFRGNRGRSSGGV